MAEAAEPSAEPQRAEGKILHPAEKFLGLLPRRDPRSVLKVSQLLLRAISEHRGLTLAALKKELGNAGYQVRKKLGRSTTGDAARPEAKGTLLRVSGSEAAGYFKVCKIPKGRKKPGRPRLEEANRWRRLRPEPMQRGRHTRRLAAKKAREVWRCNSKVTTKPKRVKAKSRESVRSRTKEDARAKGVEEGRGRPSKEDAGPGSGEERRPSSKVREEKKPEAEKPVKKPGQKTQPVKSDGSCSSQGKVRTKSSVKSDSPRIAVESP
ncbi:testis-specific H1 histone [Perognathus longimembris pacificus]|uniref:testis-specific H1 histone n=1 Tax=Perognathus longimembris pacificus TaxID=214514 RepID=UPI0020197DF1|nr:testis-specific H1 histone [Perognathus longimembris pacificus]